MSVTVRLILIASATAWLAGCRTAEESTAPRATGYVEATEVRVAARVPGRVADVLVTEGQRVEAGTVVVTLSTAEIDLMLRRVAAERAQADAQLRLLQRGARPEDIAQAEAQLAAAQSDQRAAEAELSAASGDEARFEQLLARRAGSQKQRDDARARVDQARERRRGAEERVRAARAGVERLRAGARVEEVEGARARVASVDAQLAVLQKSLGDAQVMAPAGGLVTQKLVEAGEIVAPRTPLVVVTDLDHAWANVFVPEPMVPRIMLGQAASVRTDAGSSVQGKVTFISPRAEFTPRNVQTADERSKLVYRVKITVDNSAGMLKQGMPVDADFVLP